MRLSALTVKLPVVASSECCPTPSLCVLYSSEGVWQCAERDVCLQYLVNRGASQVDPVYTLAVTNPNYLRVDQSWNWDVQSTDADGTAIGTVSQVRKPQSQVSPRKT